MFRSQPRPLLRILHVAITSPQANLASLLDSLHVARRCGGNTGIGNEYNLICPLIRGLARPFSARVHYPVTPNGPPRFMGKR